MEIHEVDSISYAQAFPKTTQVFNAAAFNAMNEYKCDKVFYLIFKDSKIRLGIIFGLRDNKLVSPFSAPFGGFETTSDDIRLQQIYCSTEAM